MPETLTIRDDTYETRVVISRLLGDVRVQVLGTLNEVRLTPVEAAHLHAWLTEYLAATESQNAR